MRLGTPVRVGEVTVTPVIATLVCDVQGSVGRMFQAMALPLGCLVVTRQGRRAFRTTGEEIDPDELEKAFPGLMSNVEGE